MMPEQKIEELEQLKSEIIRFINELDEKLEKKEIDSIQYHVLLNEKFKGKTKEELLSYIDQEINLEKKKLQGKKRKTKITISVAAIILITLVIIGILYNDPEALTGYAVGIREKQEVIDYNRVFDHYTETQLNLTNITSLRISGTLEGTRAIIKLRINNTDYLVADIVNEQQDNLITGLVIAEQQQNYTLSTDKKEYALGETVYIIIEPEVENKSLYINYKNQTHKLEDNTYNTENIGEHQVIALIVLPDDILRLETNFTVINESINITINETVNETANQTINETENKTGVYEFNDVCIDTCNILETSYPILIIEPEENTTITITKITITQNKENEAPEQTKQIPDITITTTQTATLNLDEYFTDLDNDILHYDINEISEINTIITQETLTITSQNPGTYTAYIYATDGDKLTTSNTFQIIITETNETINETINITPPTNITVNITGNETIPPTNITPTETTDPCSHPDINKRPAQCFIGIEEKVFQDLSAPVENRRGQLVGRFTRFGNLVIKGLVIQNTTTTPGADDFKIGFSEIIDFEEIRTYTAWIDDATGNLYLRGRVYEEQDVLLPPQFNTYIIQNRFGIVLGYFDELKGDLYLKGNLVQLGKI